MGPAAGTGPPRCGSFGFAQPLQQPVGTGRCARMSCHVQQVVDLALRRQHRDRARVNGSRLLQGGLLVQATNAATGARPRSSDQRSFGGVWCSGPSRPPVASLLMHGQRQRAVFVGRPVMEAAGNNMRTATAVVPRSAHSGRIRSAMPVRASIAPLCCPVRYSPRNTAGRLPGPTCPSTNRAVAWPDPRPAKPRRWSSNVSSMDPAADGRLGRPSGFSPGRGLVKAQSVPARGYTFCLHLSRLVDSLAWRFGTGELLLLRVLW